MNKPRLSIGLIPLTRGKIAKVSPEDHGKFVVFNWYASKEGSKWYACRTIKIAGKNKVTRMHREVLNLNDGEIADHKNSDGLDNRRENLRRCNTKENLRNKKWTKSLSGFKGVVWHREAKKWQAQIMADRKMHYLGLFKEKRSAAIAYNTAAKRLFGDFANYNVV